MNEKLIEAMAVAIYESWPFRAQVGWVPNGNSIKQDEARTFARLAIRAMTEGEAFEEMVERAVAASFDCELQDDARSDSMAHILLAALTGDDT